MPLLLAIVRRCAEGEPVGEPCWGEGRSSFSSVTSLPMLPVADSPVTALVDSVFVLDLVSEAFLAAGVSFFSGLFSSVAVFESRNASETAGSSPMPACMFLSTLTMSRTVHGMLRVTRIAYVPSWLSSHESLWFEGTRDV